MNYPQRKRIRMPHYDYRQSGAYFCTVCVHKMHRHKDLLAVIQGEQLVLNRFGRIVEQCWLDVPNHRDCVMIDAFVVMPNHIHLLFFLETQASKGEHEGQFAAHPPGTLGAVVGAFKGEVKRQVGRIRDEPTVVWQSRFYDRVVRDDVEMMRIRRYIENNPANWLNDRCHPQHPKFELAWQGIAPHDDF